MNAVAPPSKSSSVVALYAGYHPKAADHDANVAKSNVTVLAKSFYVASECSVHALVVLCCRTKCVVNFADGALDTPDCHSTCAGLLEQVLHLLHLQHMSS